MYNYPMFNYPVSDARSKTRRTTLARALPLGLSHGHKQMPEFAGTPYDIAGLYINLTFAALVGVLSVGMWALLSLSLN